LGLSVVIVARVNGIFSAIVIDAMERLNGLTVKSLTLYLKSFVGTDEVLSVIGSVLEIGPFPFVVSTAPKSHFF